MLQFKHISTGWQAIFKAIGTASRVQTESQYIACVQCMIQLALQASSCLAPSGGPLSWTPAGQAGPRDPEDPKELSLGRGTPSRGPPRLSRPHHALLSTGDPSRGPRRPQGPPGPSPSARGTPADAPLHWLQLHSAADPQARRASAPLQPSSCLALSWGPLSRTPVALTPTDTH